MTVKAAALLSIPKEESPHLALPYRIEAVVVAVAEHIRSRVDDGVGAVAVAVVGS